MVGETALKNRHLIQMKKELTDLWRDIDERKQRRYVAIIDSINLQIAFLDQEIQIAAGVAKMTIKKTISPNDANICNKPPNKPN